MGLKYLVRSEDAVPIALVDVPVMRIRRRTMESLWENDCRK
jgi:hypothetical protein